MDTRASSSTGSLVRRIKASRRRAEPRMIQEKVERVGDIGTFDAVCSVMSLHHADLEPAFTALTRVLRPKAQLFVYEFAWEAYDERAAAWLAERDMSKADNSVAGWNAEHAELHPANTIRAMIAETFDLESELERPYLARMLRSHDLEHEEQAMIEDNKLPALGRWYVARFSRKHVRSSTVSFSDRSARRAARRL